jgi:cysteine desulfurase/selenocysteine lyase
MKNYHALFPVTERYIYLNHAANSPEPLPVLKAMGEYLQACSQCGTVMEKEWQEVPSRVRESFARLLECPSSNVAFLPNVSAAINLVAGGLDWRPGDNIIVALDQFPANVYPWMFLQDAGVEIRTANWQTHGLVDSIRKVVDKRTRVIALSWVEYYSGHRHNPGDVGIMCEEMDIILVIDAIQGLGALPLSQPDTGADLIAAGGQKWLLGPEGQGAAFISSKLLDRLNPRVYSWRSIRDFMNFDSYRLDLRTGADRFEGGTPNWPGVIGLGAALELIHAVGPANIAARVEALTQQLINALTGLPVRTITPRAWRDRAGIVSFVPDGIPAETLRQRLLVEGIVCSARRDVLRISPHFYNTAEEIDELIAALRSILS